MTAGFKALAEAIASFPTLSQHSQFIFVPGPTDPWSSSTLPRPPIPDSFVEPIRSKVPKATFTSNPARLKYFDQEIVILREDLMGRMLRNVVQIKEGTEGANMKRYVRVDRAQTGLDLFSAQFASLLAARTNHPRSDTSITSAYPGTADNMGMGSRSPPVSYADDCEYRACPSVHEPSHLTGSIVQVILADKYERYDLTYEGCHVFNPGSFVGNSFEWSVYYPATGRSESR